MNIVISLSLDATAKDRYDLEGGGSSTERADLSQYTELEKKLRLHEEEQTTATLERKASGNTVKSKKSKAPTSNGGKNDSDTDSAEKDEDDSSKESGDAGSSDEGFDDSGDDADFGDEDMDEWGTTT